MPGVRGQNTQTGCRLWLQSVTTGCIQGLQNNSSECTTQTSEQTWLTHRKRERAGEALRTTLVQQVAAACIFLKTWDCNAIYWSKLRWHPWGPCWRIYRNFASFSTQNSCTVFAFEAAATHFACYFQIYLQKRKIISLVQLLSGILQLYQIKTAKTQKKKKTLQCWKCYKIGLW